MLLAMTINAQALGIFKLSPLRGQGGGQNLVEININGLTKHYQLKLTTRLSTASNTVPSTFTFASTL